MVGTKRRDKLTRHLLTMTWHLRRPAVQIHHARHDFGVFKRFIDTANAAGHRVVGERVLDIGCGWRFPITLLLHTFGAMVTGLDAEFVDRRLSASKLWKHFVQHGAVAFARRLVREVVHKNIYFRELERQFGSPLRFEGLDLRHTPIEDVSGSGDYDLVFSNATFEHLGDVEKAVQVVARILKPGGMAYISIHLFPSLTGGHDVLTNPGGPSVIFTPGAYPWRHLRDPGWRPPVYLNRWRESRFREVFERHLTVREWRTEFWEPEGFLTETILRELPGFTREELLKRSIVVISER
jgi:SAM-dependent methyltransferase